MKIENEEAKICYEKSMEIIDENLKDEFVDVESYAAIVFQYGCLLMYSFDDDEAAKEYFTKAIQLDPNRVEFEEKWREIEEMMTV